MGLFKNFTTISRQASALIKLPVKRILKAFVKVQMTLQPSKLVHNQNITRV